MREFANILLKFQQRFRMPMNAVRLERKAQELALIGFNHTAFVSVDH